MRLENLLAVTGGRLLNSPSISRFDDVALKPNRVKRGSLFVARSKDDIKIALQSGAYGIMTDFCVIPTDEEIAWIRVDSLSAALPKLLRLWLVINPRRFYRLDSLSMEFAKAVLCDHEALTLSSDQETASEEILSSKPNSAIFCDDPIFLERIGVCTAENIPEEILFKPLKIALFTTNATIDGTYYENLPLAGSLLPILIKTLEHLKGAGVSYSLSKLDYTPSFEPLFVDAYLREVDFGESERVFVFASRELPKKCFEELEKIRWTAAKVYMPTQIKFEYDIKLPTIKYESERELFAHLIKDVKKPGYFIFLDKKRESLLKDLQRFEREETLPTTKGLF
ncbi:MAG: hypothetical protein L3J42_06610 [Hydrogenimonas sp.]|nr:hypothetical protein [Hydrogenimonas sp.]